MRNLLITLLIICTKILAGCQISNERNSDKFIKTEKQSISEQTKDIPITNLPYIFEDYNTDTNQISLGYNKFLENQPYDSKNIYGLNNF